jgi:hypothetical protein
MPVELSYVLRVIPSGSWVVDLRPFGARCGSAGRALDASIEDLATCPPIPSPLPGRPFYVHFEGGKLYISAHDAFHLEKEREFRRLIRAAHPDRNHCIWAAARTRKLLKARKRWEEKEARWYARFGLEPPRGKPQRAGSRVRASIAEQSDQSDQVAHEAVARRLDTGRSPERRPARCFSVIRRADSRAKPSSRSR